jgi:hypothetical protein
MRSYIAADVRFGSKTDMCGAKSHIRFTPESGHVHCTSVCPLCAKSRHAQLLDIISTLFAQAKVRFVPKADSCSTAKLTLGDSFG